MVVDEEFQLLTVRDCRRFSIINYDKASLFIIFKGGTVLLLICPRSLVIEIRVNINNGWMVRQ